MANEAEADRELHGQTTLSNGPTLAWRIVRKWPKIEDCGELFHDNLSPGTSHKNKVSIVTLELQFGRYLLREEFEAGRYSPSLKRHPWAPVQPSSSSGIGLSIIMVQSGNDSKRVYICILYVSFVCELNCFFLHIDYIRFNWGSTQSI